MSTKPPDLHRWDVAAFADRAGEHAGRTAVRDFTRLAGDDDQTGLVIEWRLRGERRDMAGSAPSVRLYVSAQGAVARTCQRCLEPVALKLQVDHRLRFVRGEAAAARLDAQSDDDVLALEPALNVHELIEDELLLALPVTAMHADCQAPDAGLRADETLAAKDASAAESAPDTDHPFAALAVLKRQRDIH